jgi:hypothetical protein
VSLKKSKGKAVEVTVNSKAENSEDFCLDFVLEFGLHCLCKMIFLLIFDAVLSCLPF